MDGGCSYELRFCNGCKSNRKSKAARYSAERNLVHNRTLPRRKCHNRTNPDTPRILPSRNPQMAPGDAEETLGKALGDFTGSPRRSRGEARDNFFIASWGPRKPRGTRRRPPGGSRATPGNPGTACSTAPGSPSTARSTDPGFRSTSSMATDFARQSGKTFRSTSPGTP